MWDGEVGSHFLTGEEFALELELSKRNLIGIELLESRATLTTELAEFHFVLLREA